MYSISSLSLGNSAPRSTLKDKQARRETSGGEPSHASSSALFFCAHHGTIRRPRLTQVKSLGSSHHYLFLCLAEKQALVLIASLISLHLESQLYPLLFTWFSHCVSYRREGCDLTAKVQSRRTGAKVAIPSTSDDSAAAFC